MTESTTTSDSRGLSRRALFRSAGAVAAVGAVGAGLPAVASGGAGSVEPLRLVRVWAVTRAQQKLLAGFDDTHNVFEDGSIEYLLWPGDLARLKATGLRYEVTVPDLVAHERTAAPGGPPPPRSPVRPGPVTTGRWPTTRPTCGRWRRRTRPRPS